MDFLLELMSWSGTSSTSVSLCPFWLKCCGTHWYGIRSLVLHASSVFSESVGTPGMFLHLRHSIM